MKSNYWHAIDFDHINENVIIDLISNGIDLKCPVRCVFVSIKSSVMVAHDWRESFTTLDSSLVTFCFFFGMFDYQWISSVPKFHGVNFVTYLIFSNCLCCAKPSQIHNLMRVTRFKACVRGIHTHWAIKYLILTSVKNWIAHRTRKKSPS